MHSDGKTYYPTRSYIRFQAKNQLIEDLMEGHLSTAVNHVGQSGVTFTLNADVDISSDISPDSAQLNDSPELQDMGNINTWPTLKLPLDEGLFAEITSTTFHHDRHPELYQPNASMYDVAAIEQAIAIEIVSTYKQILKNRSDQHVQNLNALL